MGWRRVPTHPATADCGLAFDRKLYVVRRTDLLRKKQGLQSPRAQYVDPEALLHNPLISNNCIHFEPKDVYNFHLEQTLAALCVEGICILPDL